MADPMRVDEILPKELKNRPRGVGQNSAGGHPFPVNDVLPMSIRWIVLYEQEVRRLHQAQPRNCHSPVGRSFECHAGRADHR